MRPRWATRPGRHVLPIALAAAALLVGVAVLRVSGVLDGDAATAVVAVTYGDASLAAAPSDLRLRFATSDGDLVAERRCCGDGTSRPDGGLVQEVPAGELELEVTAVGSDVPGSCTGRADLGPGARLIMRLQPGSLTGEASGARCVVPERVRDWVGGWTGPVADDYVGMRLAAAEDRARDRDVTWRVTAIDGARLPVTEDFRPGRVNFAVFDGTVVAAYLDGARSL